MSQIGVGGFGDRRAAAKSAYQVDQRFDGTVLAGLLDHGAATVGGGEVGGKCDEGLAAHASARSTAITVAPDSWNTCADGGSQASAGPGDQDAHGLNCSLSVGVDHEIVCYLLDPLAYASARTVRARPLPVARARATAPRGRWCFRMDFSASVGVRRLASPCCQGRFYCIRRRDHCVDVG